MTTNVDSQNRPDAIGKDDALEATYAKVTRRLVPLLFVCYVINQIDRVNISYAMLRMRPDLGFTDGIYGLGASIFFLGYFLFEVPSNLLLQKIGARKTILRIMFVWGLVSAATAFVRTPLEFYFARLLLGIFEAGFLPGVVLYLTFWYPSARRARIIAFFMTAIVISGIVAGPVSGWILQNLDGSRGLRGWQWMYLLEGLPATVLGVIVYFWLADRPADARWLSSNERSLVQAAVEEDAKSAPLTLRGQLTALREPKVYVLAFLYFTIGCGAYTLAFWTPSMIHALGISSPQQVGLYAVIPYSVGALAMVLYGRHSDKVGERRIHFSVACLWGAAALVASTFVVGNRWLSLTLLSAATAGVVSAYPVFWAAATSALARSSSAAAIATITSLGSLSGVVSPYTIGMIKTSTGSLDLGLYLVAAVLACGGVLMLSKLAKTSSDQATSPTPQPLARAQVPSTASPGD